METYTYIHICITAFYIVQHTKMADCHYEGSQMLILKKHGAA